MYISVDNFLSYDGEVYREADPVQVQINHLQQDESRYFFPTFLAQEQIYHRHEWGHGHDDHQADGYPEIDVPIVTYCERILNLVANAYVCHDYK